MNDSAVYLDHNATTPLLPEVVDAMLPYLREHYGNPSSSHALGVRARAAVDQARAQVAALAQCEPSQVVFTSGGTEANNLAIFGSLAASPRRGVITSAIEHPATSAPCRALAERGHPVTTLAVDSEGFVGLDALEAALSDDTALVTIMHANNETGTLEPIAEICERARRRGALVHTDAAQSAGKLPIDALAADLISIAGHKLGAPKGVGALILRHRTPLSPVLLGAGHEGGMRPGTENVAAIVGLGVACAAAVQRLARGAPERVRALTDGLFWRLRAEIPELKLNGPLRERLPNTLNVSFPAVSGAALLARAPELYASTGSACHEGGEEPSSVLTAMGMDRARALGAVRLSLGHATREPDIERAARALLRAYEELVS